MCSGRQWAVRLTSSIERLTFNIEGVTVTISRRELRKQCLAAIREADRDATVGVIMLAKIVLQLIDDMDETDAQKRT